MNDKRPREAALPPELALKVDAACDRFEAEWRAGGRPSIEDYLGEAVEPERAALLRQLILLDVDYRQRHGEQPNTREYQDRFPWLEEPQNLASDRPVPPEGAATVAYCPDEAAGIKIGPYKLLQRMGEGGMGSVWMAEQTEPVQRRVALKIIKASLGGDHILARFEAERQALAMMDHPNIAKVLDAGTIGSEPRPI